MKTRFVSIFMAIAALAACSDRPPSEKPPVGKPVAAAALPGSDRDAHGCIASAGYSWCEGTGKCERSWELAKEKGFDNSAEAFDQYCKNPVK